MQSESGDEWISCREEECFRAIEGHHPNLEHDYVHEMETASRKIWGSFQDSATSVAQLYRDKTSSDDTSALWLPFQTAAGTVTSLYKDSCDAIKRTNDVAVQFGYQRRSREIADWARNKRRRYIRREDLLSYLAGKPPPPLHVSRSTQLRSSPKPELQNVNNHHNIVQLGAAFGVTHNQNSVDNDLHTFKEALARKPRAPELYAFVAGEIARHCKRPASPLDVNMEVQNLNSKRQRFM